jgi:hypothetical protein
MRLTTSGLRKKVRSPMSPPTRTRQTSALTQAQRGPARAQVMPRLTQAAAQKPSNASEFDDQRRSFPTQALIIVN